jgi:hypothetical protein
VEVGFSEEKLRKLNDSFAPGGSALILVVEHRWFNTLQVEMAASGGQLIHERLSDVSYDDLLKKVIIRQEPLTVIDAVNRQLAHYPHHIGQLLYVGKIIKNDQWKNLSIPKGHSDAYNKSDGLKDPAKGMKA